MSVPVISVLMPVFNTELFLSVAIESILRQTFSDFELIIVVDGSTDGSLRIAEGYQGLDNRVTVVSQTNMGISATRNRLVSMAKSDYIAWMDSDDVSLPKRLEMQYQFLRKNTNYVAVGIGTELIDDKGMKICQWKIPENHADIDAWHAKGRGGAIVFASSMMTKVALDKVGVFNENLIGAEDLCLFLRLAEIGRLKNIEQVAFQYRQHINSISHSDKLKIIKDNQSVLDAACKRRGLKPLVRKSLKKDISEVYDTYTKWGWWALNGKNIRTAKKYAIKSLVSNPFNKQAWKLLACSIRGY